MTVGASEALASRLRAAELERRTLQATLEQAPQLQVSATEIASRYRQLVMNLKETLSGEANTVTEARPLSLDCSVQSRCGVTRRRAKAGHK